MEENDERKKVVVLFDSQASRVPESPPMSQVESESQLDLLLKLTTPVTPNDPPPTVFRQDSGQDDLGNYDIIEDEEEDVAGSDPLPPGKYSDVAVQEEIMIEDVDENEVKGKRSSDNLTSRLAADVVIDMDMDDEGPGIGVVASHDSFYDDDTSFVQNVEKLEQESFLGGDTGGQGQGQSDGTVSKYRTEQDRLDEVAKMKKLEPGEKIFPDVKASPFHTVAFFLTSLYKHGDELVPHPAIFQSKWDNEFVALPCAKQNTRLYKIRMQTDSQNYGDDRPRYREERIWMWMKIEGALTLPILSCSDLSLALKQYIPFKTELKALDYCVETLMSAVDRYNFFAKVLPRIQSLCLDLERCVTCPLPLLKKFKNHSISLSQRQIASLLANAFFSTFPKRFGDDEDQYPSINFLELFQSEENESNPASKLATKANKIRCILNYFERVADYMPSGVVTFTRKSIRHAAAPNWETLTKKVSKIVPLLHGTIEDDGVGMLQVDFANKFVGGGFLSRGAVQEEILFAIYPELIISRLFTEKLTSCEALIVTGCERFSRYSGYASTFKYDGDFIDVTSLDSKGRRCSQFVAIDALYITRPITQFNPRFLARELNKAYVGLSSPTGSSVPVATGKWGCGAFNGNPQLKAILQLLAASQAGRDVVFFTFGDAAIQQEIEEMYETIKNCTIQQVWQLLCQYHTLFCSTPKPKYNLYEYLVRFANGEEDVTATASISDSSPKINKGGNPPLKSSKLKEVPITSFYSKDDNFEKSAPPMDDERSFPSTSMSLERALNGGANADLDLNFIQRPKISKTPFLKATTPISKTAISSNSEAKKKFSKNDVLTDNQITDLLDENSQQDSGLVENQDVVCLENENGISSSARQFSPIATQNPRTLISPASKPKAAHVRKQSLQSLTDFDFYKQ